WHSAAGQGVMWRRACEEVTTHTLTEARPGRLLQVLGYSADLDRYGNATGAHHAMVPGRKGRVGAACGHRYTHDHVDRRPPEDAHIPCPKCERLLGPAMGRPVGSTFGEDDDDPAQLDVAMAQFDRERRGKLQLALS